MSTPTPAAPQAVEAPQAAAAHATAHSRAWIAASVAAFVLALAAWLAMSVSEYASGACAVLSLIASIAGSWLAPKGFWRNLAITSLIASAVLLLVYALFIGGIAYAVSML